MTKNVALIFLAVGCILAIYNLKTPTKTSQDMQEQVTVVEESIVPVTDVAQVSVAPKVEATSIKKVATLKEILSSKNDNDPRLDTEFKNLSNEDKDALVGFYRDLKAESLNDKGTIVFLIGREISRPEDAEFLKAVLSEEPCLSLDNCGVTNAEKDPHTDSVNNVTLNYPQVVALNRIKNYVQTHDLQTVNPSLLSHLIDATKMAQNSNVAMVKNRAEEVADILKQKK